jgi:cyclic pyranopterin phosphate synthase
MSKLNHFDDSGQAHMVDVGEKAETHRRATACGRISMLPATFELIRTGGAKKGDVLGIARIAAIQGAKRTPDLIPLSHPLMITRVAVEFLPERRRRASNAVRRLNSRTDWWRDGGARNVNAGLLTIYDMEGVGIAACDIRARCWKNTVASRAISSRPKLPAAPAQRR